MINEYPAGTVLGARYSYPEDWPADEMPAGDSEPAPYEGRHVCLSPFQGDETTAAYLARHATVSRDVTGPYGAYMATMQLTTDLMHRLLTPDDDVRYCGACGCTLVLRDGQWCERGIDEDMRPELCSLTDDARHQPI